MTPRHSSPVKTGKPRGKSGQRGAKAKADRLFSLLVRTRGACENCGEREYAKLQCAHIVSRRYSNTRCDLDNAFCLCAGCHMHFTYWPLEFAEFVIGKIGADAYARLKAKANSNAKVDWLVEVERLHLLSTLPVRTIRVKASNPVVWDA